MILASAHIQLPRASMHNRWSDPNCKRSEVETLLVSGVVRSWCRLPLFCPASGCFRGSFFQEDLLPLCKQLSSHNKCVYDVPFSFWKCGPSCAKDCVDVVELLWCIIFLLLCSAPSDCLLRMCFILSINCLTYYCIFIFVYDCHWYIVHCVVLLRILTTLRAGIEWSPSINVVAERSTQPNIFTACFVCVNTIAVCRQKLFVGWLVFGRYAACHRHIMHLVRPSVLYRLLTRKEKIVEKSKFGWMLPWIGVTSTIIYSSKGQRLRLLRVKNPTCCMKSLAFLAVTAN